MLLLDGNSLTIEDVIKVARDYSAVGLSEAGRTQIIRSREVVEKLLKEERPLYGISTGFGEFSKIFISAAEREKLQRNLILSHATGTGAYFSEEVVRACMILRVNSLTKGFSGIRLETVEKLLELLNKRVYPAVPCKGSVGASGDLAPLSHIALVLLGEGEAFVDGVMVSGAEALKAAEISSIVLGGKEGLALINGTQVMTAVGLLTCYDAECFLKTADAIVAMSLEALRGTRTAFDPRIAMVRQHKGHAVTSTNVLRMTAESEIMDSHVNCGKVQDAYSLRCVPQVHGASKDMLRHVRSVLDTEINSVTDNPLIIPDTGDVLSGGNFHGQPIAIVMDALKIALAEIANISERRINRLLDTHLSDLPMFLTAYPGVDSGLMILQYTAASLVSENKVLAHPASVDSIPTSANQEDHVSMGTIAARQANEILVNMRQVLAIELIAAAQALDFLTPLLPGKGVRAVHDYMRSQVTHLDEDRYLAPDLRAVDSMIERGAILRAAESAIGALEY